MTELPRHVHELLQSRLDLLLSVHSRRRAERLAALDAEIALLKSLVRRGDGLQMCHADR